MTDFGTINLNNEIQKIVNPDIQEGKFIKKTIKKKEVFFKVNDIILNCQNTYEILTLSGYNEIKNSGNALTVEDVEKTNKILKSRKEKYAFEITELAKEISEE